jgi:hypothetical protein
MKKLMLVLGLMSIVIFTHATEQSKSKPSVNVKQSVWLLTLSSIADPTVGADRYDCTMSATMTVSVGVVKVEASCSATGATCEQALATAEGCVTAVIKRFASILK